MLKLLPTRHLARGLCALGILRTATGAPGREPTPARAQMATQRLLDARAEFLGPVAADVSRLKSPASESKMKWLAEPKRLPTVAANIFRSQPCFEPAPFKFNGTIGATAIRYLKQ
jgi:hypothetical protein